MYYRCFIQICMAIVFTNTIAQTGKSEQQLIDEYFKKQNQSISITDTGSTSNNKEIITKTANTNLKFVILCFDSSPSNNDEISSLNKLAYEYRRHISSVVIYANDLNTYTEIFTRKELKSLQDFIQNKKEYQKKATSFPVILILDSNGKVINAWSGDKTDDGLKRDEFYNKIKLGLQSVANQK